MKPAVKQRIESLATLRGQPPKVLGARFASEGIKWGLDGLYILVDASSHPAKENVLTDGLSLEVTRADDLVEINLWSNAGTIQKRILSRGRNFIAPEVVAHLKAHPAGKQLTVIFLAEVDGAIRQIKQDHLSEEITADFVLLALLRESDFRNLKKHDEPFTHSEFRNGFVDFNSRQTVQKLGSR